MCIEKEIERIEDDLNKIPEREDNISDGDDSDDESTPEESVGHRQDQG